MGGKKYTSYKSNGSAMSRLDRFLISPDMFDVIGLCCQLGLKWCFSDHCPVLLKPDKRD